MILHKPVLRQLKSSDDVWDLRVSPRPCFSSAFGVPVASLSASENLKVMNLEGKLESRPTVTRLSLGCLILKGIVDRRRCARAKLVVQLRERYSRLITRGIVTFIFSTRNLTQVNSTMKPGQDSMVGFSSVKRITLREGLY